MANQHHDEMFFLLSLYWINREFSAAFTVTGTVTGHGRKDEMYSFIYRQVKDHICERAGADVGPLLRNSEAVVMAFDLSPNALCSCSPDAPGSVPEPPALHIAAVIPFTRKE